GPTLQGHTQPVAWLAFSPDGRILATTTGHVRALSRPGEVKLWAVPSMTNRASEQAHEIRAFAGHQGAVFGAAFSPDGKLLATACHDQAVRLWNVAAGELVATLRGPQSHAGSVAFSPDGRILATGFGGGSIALWDVMSRRMLLTWKGHQERQVV